MNIREAELMAINLMEKHGLFDEGWFFEFDRAQRRFGCCHHRTKTITISKPLVKLNEEHHVKDTILHEIAHALVGSRNGHNRIWKNKAFEIGADPTRCYDSTVVQPKAKWLGTCPGCSRETKRFKRMTIACSICCRQFNNGRYSEEFKFIWTPLI